MASQSRSQTPPTTPISREGEVEEIGLSPRQDDPHGSEDSASLFSIAEIPDDNERASSYMPSRNQGRILSSLSSITPSIQTMLGRRYLPLDERRQSGIPDNTLFPRRSPVRLAREAFPSERWENQRRSISPSQETLVNQLRSSSPPLPKERPQQPSTSTRFHPDLMQMRRSQEVSNQPPLQEPKERPQQPSTSTRFHPDLMQMRRAQEVSNQPSLQEQKEKVVSFFSSNTSDERKKPSSEQQSECIQESVSSTTRLRRRSEEPSRYQRYRRHEDLSSTCFMEREEEVPSFSRKNSRLILERSPSPPLRSSQGMERSRSTTVLEKRSEEPTRHSKHREQQRKGADKWSANQQGLHEPTMSSF